MSTPLERLLAALPNARLCSLEVIANAYCAAEDRAIKAEAALASLPRTSPDEPAGTSIQRLIDRAEQAEARVRELEAGVSESRRDAYSEGWAEGYGVAKAGVSP